MIKDNLKHIMKNAGITNERLSEMTEIPILSISHYRTGKAHPTETNIMKIAYALGVSIDELLNFSEYCKQRDEEKDNDQD